MAQRDSASPGAKISGFARHRIPGVKYEAPTDDSGRLRLHTITDNTSSKRVAYLSRAEPDTSFAGCPHAASAHQLVAGVGQRMLVSVRHRLLFCPIEKVALSAWVRLFFALYEKPCRVHPWVFTSLRFATSERELPLLQAFAERDAARALECGRWTRAVAVRDPLDRLLSAFLDKCVNGVQRRRHCPHWRESRQAPPSFRAFVERLTAHDVEEGDRIA